MSAISSELEELSSIQRSKQGIRLTSKKPLDGVMEAKIEIEYQLNQLTGGASILSPTKVEYNGTLLYEFIKQGDIESVRKMIVDNLERINDRIEDKETALYVVKDKETALYAAVRYQFSDIVHFLLKNGADPNLKSSNGCTPLIHICTYSDAYSASNVMDTSYKIYKDIQTIIAKHLIDFGADVNSICSVDLPYLFLGHSYTQVTLVRTPITSVLEKFDVNLEILEALLKEAVNLRADVLYCVREESDKIKYSYQFPVWEWAVQPALYFVVTTHSDNKNIQDALFSKIRDQTRKNVQFDLSQEKYSQHLKGYIQKFIATGCDIPGSKTLIELLLNEVYEPLMHEYQQKSTFLLGLDPKLGSMSAIGSESFAKNTIFERKIIPLIFQYALTTSKMLEVPKNEPIPFDIGSMKDGLEVDPGPEYTVDVSGMFRPRIILKPLPPGGMSIFSQGASLGEQTSLKRGF